MIVTFALDISWIKKNDAIKIILNNLYFKKIVLNFHFKLKKLNQEPYIKTRWMVSYFSFL